MASILLKSSSIPDIELILILATKLGIETEKINYSNDIVIPENIDKQSLKHNFLNSKGIWKNRSIDSKTLRNEAWNIQGYFYVIQI
jgi:hypothetical protein